jgi:hypothetical protein
MAELPIVERLRGRKDGDVSLTCREVIEAAELIEKLYEALEVTHAYARQCGWHLAIAADDDAVEKEFAEKLVAAEERMRDTLALAKGEKQG